MVFTSEEMKTAANAFVDRRAVFLGGLRMRMVATVMRSASIREHFVVTRVVGADAINTVGHADDEWAAQVADERGDGNVNHVVAEAAAIRPAAGNRTAVAKGVLNRALQHVATEDA